MLALKPDAFSSSNGVEKLMPKWRVLLAEDDPISQRIGSKLLQRAGLHVDVVGNGRDAVDMALRHEYHIILMDIRMPSMDGMMATRKIREMENIEQRKPVPILGLSAHALEEMQKDCKKAGMDDFLTKPFDSKMVLSRIKKQINGLD